MMGRPILFNQTNKLKQGPGTETLLSLWERCIQSTQEDSEAVILGAIDPTPSPCRPDTDDLRFGGAKMPRGTPLPRSSGLEIFPGQGKEWKNFSQSPRENFRAFREKSLENFRAFSGKHPVKFPGKSGQCASVLMDSSAIMAPEIFQDPGPADPPEIFQEILPEGNFFRVQGKFPAQRWNWKLKLILEAEVECVN